MEAGPASTCACWKGSPWEGRFVLWPDGQKFSIVARPVPGAVLRVLRQVTKEGKVEADRLAASCCISTGAFLQAIAEAVVPAQWTRERQELLASDALTPASRHSVTAGESCAGSTVADVCDIAWL